MLGVVRLAPWRRAPLLLWRFRAVWASFAGVGAVLAVAVSVPPLYLSAAASASVAAQQEGRCSWAAGLQASGEGVLPNGISRSSSSIDIARSVLGPAGEAAVAADGRRGQLGAPVATLLGGTLDLQPPPGRPYAEPARLVYRDDALGHVRLVARVPGEGVLLTEEIARALEVVPGQTVRIGSGGNVATALVVGVYRDLGRQPPDPYWCSIDHLLRLRNPFGNPLPPVALATSAAVVLDLLPVVHGSQAPSLGARIERPLLPDLRLDQAEATLEVVQAAQRQAPNRTGSRRGAPTLLTEVPYLVRRSHAVQDAVAPPLRALAAGAAAACLSLVAVAGSFWAERRRKELDLLAVRGVAPAATAVKGALEGGPPLLVGLCAGGGLSVGLITLLGPDGGIDHRARLAALLLLLGAWPLALLTLAGSVAWLRRPRRPWTGGAFARRRSQVLAAGEVLALLGSLVALTRVTGVPAPAQDQLPSFGLTRLLLPLLVLVFAVLVLVRLLTFLLPLARGRGESWPAAPLLALQRLAAQPRVPAALLLIVALATGTCVYATGVAHSLRQTVAAKAQVFVGSDTALELQGQQPVPDVGVPLTAVHELADTTLSGSPPSPLQVLAIDPATFEGAAFWRKSFADAPLRDVLRRLEQPQSPRLPALVVGQVPDNATALVAFGASAIPLPLDVRARLDAFPGMGTDPLVVVSERVLRDGWPDALRYSTERLWLRGPTEPAFSRLKEAGLQVRYVKTAAEVSTAPALEAVLSTLRVLTSLGVLTGVLALLGLAVYVDVRARRRRLAAVLTSRMGLRPGREWLSQWLELGSLAVLGVLIGATTSFVLLRHVTALLDPLAGTPPGPVADLPMATVLTMLALAAAATAAVTAPRRRRRPGADAMVLRAE